MAPPVYYYRGDHTFIPITVFLTFRRHHIHAMIFDKKKWAIKTLNFSNNDVEHRISKNKF